MGEWGYLIVLFGCLWLLQVVFTYFQNKHYGQTVREMSMSHSPGYLGVGVVKKRFGTGCVMILVSDLSGKIVQAKELTGVTVFSRFRPVSDLIGKRVQTLYKSTDDQTRARAIKMACERILEEKEREDQNENLVSTSIK